MKILAATKSTSHGRTKYIAELTSEELNTLAGLTPYAEIQVTDESGVERNRNRDELVCGDVVSGALFSAVNIAIQTFLGERKNIENHMSHLKGAITKLQNVLPKL